MASNVQQVQQVLRDFGEAVHGLADHVGPISDQLAAAVGAEQSFTQLAAQIGQQLGQMAQQQGQMAQQLSPSQAVQQLAQLAEDAAVTRCVRRNAGKRASNARSVATSGLAHLKKEVWGGRLPARRRRFLEFIGIYNAL